MPDAYQGTFTRSIWLIFSKAGHSKWLVLFDDSSTRERHRRLLPHLLQSSPASQTANECPRWPRNILREGAKLTTSQGVDSRKGRFTRAIMTGLRDEVSGFKRGIVLLSIGGSQGRAVVYERVGRSKSRPRQHMESEQLSS